MVKSVLKSLRSQFRSLGALLLLAIVVSSAMMVLSIRLWQDGEDLSLLGDQIAAKVGDLVSLSSQAHVDRGVQARWASYQNELVQAMDSLPDSFSTQKREARRLLLWSQDVFALLLDVPNDAAAELRRQAMHAVLLNLADVGEEIKLQALAQRRQAIRTAYVVQALGFLFILLWAVGSSQFLRIKVLRVLYETVERLRRYGQGDHSVRLALGHSREFDDLAQAFNHNADLLESTTVSRDALQAEVQARTQAQAQLVHAYKALQESAQSLELAASVFSNAVEGVMITGADKVIVEVNNAFTAITGYSRLEAIGQTPRMLRSGKHDDDFYRLMWEEINNKGTWSGEIWNRNKDGHTYPEHLRISMVRDEAGEVKNYIGFFEDITESLEAQMRMQQMAHFDILTQLPNRMLLTDRLEQALLQSDRSGQTVAVVFLDLDGFKEVNDTHDHQTGDALLVALTQRMRAALRGADTLARLGGDEFVAVLVGVDQSSSLEAMIRRLLEAARSRVVVEFNGREVELQVSASAGVTVYPDDKSPAGLLIRHADLAMYQAKQSGKNRFHTFDLAHESKIQQDLAFVRSVREGIDRQQFVLFYQPKLNLLTGEIFGVEALVRWQHPTLGLCSPAKFLPQIEHDVTNELLGAWVLHEALSQWQSWHAKGVNLEISVNISAHQLHSPYFFERLVEELGQFPDFPPSSLELEVLETSALENIDKVSEAMLACMGLGVSFALDDFGTGYSTLTYLKRLPARTLKIDQSFVRNMLDDANDLVIVQGVISLANTFGRTVIAEGVETIKHIDELLHMGCESAQGYAIAKPMPARELVRWLPQWKASTVGLFGSSGVDVRWPSTILIDNKQSQR
jgi:diguanylate cyclase (GGDEF)-like protein/PAS domain S-box-containing protein